MSQQIVFKNRIRNSVILFILQSLAVSPLLVVSVSDVRKEKPLLCGRESARRSLIHTNRCCINRQWRTVQRLLSSSLNSRTSRGSTVKRERKRESTKGNFSNVRGDLTLIFNAVISAFFEGSHSTLHSELTIPGPKLGHNCTIWIASVPLNIYLKSIQRQKITSHHYPQQVCTHSLW